MVITLLGKDLGSYLKIFKTFSIKTVIQLADQLLSVLEKVHAAGIIHRDIKPENIVMGRNEAVDTCYLIDFGISKYFKDSRGRHIQMKDKKSFIGTTRYASISAHQGIELSRKDDLESLGYVLIFLLKGALPWQNLNVSDKEKTKKVGEMKAKIPVEELCKDLPQEIANYMTYVKSLLFAEDPDYSYLHSLLKQIATQKKITFDKKWDWSTGAMKKTSNQKPVSNKNLGSFLEEKNLLSVNAPKVARTGSTQNLLVPDLSSQVENTYNTKSMISQCASIMIQKDCNDLENDDFNCFKNFFIIINCYLVSVEESKEFTTYQIKNIAFMMRQLEAKKVKAQFINFQRNAFVYKS